MFYPKNYVFQKFIELVSLLLFGNVQGHTIACWLINFGYLPFFESKLMSKSVMRLEF